MTTILACSRRGVMVSDSSVTDDDRVWVGKKVWRVRGALVGMAGGDPQRMAFLDWYRRGMKGEVSFEGASALVLTPSGLFMYDSNYTSLQVVESGVEAIGTGGKAAMCAYEALDFTDPRKAVRVVCKHDAASRTPVRVYTL